jgi:hypothetical protein
LPAAAIAGPAIAAMAPPTNHASGALLNQVARVIAAEAAPVASSSGAENSTLCCQQCGGDAAEFHNSVLAIFSVTKLCSAEHVCCLECWKRFLVRHIRKTPSVACVDQCVVHALKGLACRARVTLASSPASH